MDNEETTPIKEASGFVLDVTDSRENKDTSQQFAVSERLKADGIDVALQKTYEFLNGYTAARPENLSIELVDDTNDEDGSIEGKIIKIQLPCKEIMITKIRNSIDSLLSDKKEKDKDKIAEELAIALVSSTVLHEGIHGLLLSRPGSQFASDFEAIMGLPNEEGKDSTLLDEGIAYAIQGIYAPDVEPVGSLTPVARETDEREVRQRKVLGEKLRSVIKTYIDNGKCLDTEFFRIAGRIISEIQVSET